MWIGSTAMCGKRRNSVFYQRPYNCTLGKQPSMMPKTHNCASWVGSWTVVLTLRPYSTMARATKVTKIIVPKTADADENGHFLFFYCRKESTLPCAEARIPSAFLVVEKSTSHSAQRTTHQEDVTKHATQTAKSQGLINNSKSFLYLERRTCIIRKVCILIILLHNKNAYPDFRACEFC